MRAELRDALLTAIADPEVDAFDWLARKLVDLNFKSSIPQTLAALQEPKALVVSYGLDLVAYEGDQHVHHMWGVPKDALALTNFFIEFVRSLQMADLYQVLWDGWPEIGDGPFMQFGSVEQFGSGGSWALWVSFGDSSARGDLGCFCTKVRNATRARVTRKISAGAVRRSPGGARRRSRIRQACWRAAS
jgi:hypothetical protein